jgi:hypothetical protein
VTIGPVMASPQSLSDPPVRPDVVARVRARLASGERPDVDAVALAIIAWTCRPLALAS